MKIKILIADDHKILREGLRLLLSKEPDFDVIAEASSGKAAIQLACELKPDIILMDISMPDINGIEATKKILSKVPKVKILALSTYSDKRFITEMFNAGASGYLVKDCAFDEVSTAVRTVAANQKFVSPSIMDTVVDLFLDKNIPSKEKTRELTERETEILRMITQGKNTKEIASELFISVKTVDTHRQHIMDKLDIHNVVELTKYAISTGLISIDQ
ncbi:response regulator [Candidatus Latescibacterota bacterium]